MRKLASLQKVEEVLPIEGADRIEKIRVEGWWLVSEKGNFKPGDLCLYLEVDSLLPLDNPAWAFLEKGTKPKKMNVEGVEYVGYRLKTIRLRGQLSQGLALPLSAVLKADFPMTDPIEEMIGYDLTEKLGIIKYEQPIPASLAGIMKGNFPGFIPKTDEERVQNVGPILEKYKYTMMYITEKLDGSSVTFYKRRGEFGVCSRNWELKDSEGNTQWRLAKKYALEERLPDGYAIQGEVVGEGIQRNPYRIQGQDVYIFNVFNIEEKRYLDFKDTVTFVGDLGGIKLVPIVQSSHKLVEGVDELVYMADGDTLLGGRDISGKTAEREGLVFRPLEEVRDPEIPTLMGRLSFKAISNRYLLNHDE